MMWRYDNKFTKIIRTLAKFIVGLPNIVLTVKTLTGTLINIVIVTQFVLIQGSGAPNPEVQEHQHEDVLLQVGDQIVNPIEYPNQGPDEIHIENVAVEDVIPEGIVAEEDPDKNE